MLSFKSTVEYILFPGAAMQNALAVPQPFEKLVMLLLLSTATTVNH